MLACRVLDTVRKSQWSPVTLLLRHPSLQATTSQRQAVCPI